MSNKPYEHLRSVLNAALDQAASGKGKERHANDEPFEEQEICTEARKLGLAGPIFQVRKKAREAKRLAENGEYEKAKADLLGAINYLAATYIVVEEKEEDGEVKPQSRYRAVVTDGSPISFWIE